MDIQIKQDANLSILTLNGRLDANTAKDLESSFKEVLDKQQFNILVDCEKLSYISSAGLRTFLSTATQCSKSNGKVSLCTLSPHIKQVFEISGFVGIFPIFDSQAEALETL